MGEPARLQGGPQKQVSPKKAPLQGGPSKRKDSPKTAVLTGKGQSNKVLTGTSQRVVKPSNIGLSG